jgi:hypothetical protein
MPWVIPSWHLLEGYPVARSPKPWYREDRQAWFVTINGKRVNLGSDEKEAIRKFHELMAAPEPQPSSSPQHASLSVAETFEKFLEWCQKRRSPETYEWTRYRIQMFIDACGDAVHLPATALTVKSSGTTHHRFLAFRSPDDLHCFSIPPIAFFACRSSVVMARLQQMNGTRHPVQRPAFIELREFSRRGNGTSERGPHSFFAVRFDQIPGDRPYSRNSLLTPGTLLHAWVIGIHELAVLRQRDGRNQSEEAKTKPFHTMHVKPP